MKPMIKYRGGKSKEIQFFEEFIPQEYNRYFEPFFWVEELCSFTLSLKRQL